MKYCISMDFIIELPTTKSGFNAIWVIVDRLSKRIILIPTFTKLSSEKAAHQFVKHYFPLHGIPKSIISDRDPRFTSKFWTELMNILGTKLNMTVSHRPQADGQTERYNRTLEEYLRNFVNPNQDDWDEKLPLAEYAINSTYNSTIKMTPFYADLGYEPNNPINSIIATKKRKNDTTINFLQHQQQVLNNCINNIRLAQLNMEYYYNKNRKPQLFNVNDQVYLSTKHLDPAHTGFPVSAKFGPKWIGPYTIEKKISDNAYKLKFGPNIQFHPVFNTSSLKPYTAPTHDSEPQQVILRDGTMGYRVLSILKHKKNKGKIQYLINWENMEPTWETYNKDDHKQIQGLIDLYHSGLHKERRTRRRKQTEGGVNVGM